MGLRSFMILGLLPWLLSAHVLGARQSVTCDFTVAASSGDTCTTFAAEWGLTEEGFQALNPSVACPTTLVAGQSYCVLGTVSSVTSTSPTTTATSTTTTTTKPTITSTFTSATKTTTSSPHEPTQSGLVSNCNNFYLVSSGDSCAAIESKFGISAQEFDSWNPSINSDCTNLFLGYYVCVGVPGATTTTTAATKTTTSSPHEPTQSGLVSNCNNFYLVSSGDTCAAIESKFGISAQEFDSWNPSINSDCTNLFLGYYVCVGVPGAVTTTTSRTATSTAPSPEMPSIVSNCKKFHLVKSGDTCATIEAASSITKAQFVSWNPAVDSACDNLWLGYYVCVGV
ncbi:putative LysM domain protein [Talaromyces proteolyticus]|uniref:LysM domain protein n=1 Tax=Talaromyces proteolyticus TaxID=1131652 RepID=A0AAD4L0C0_9EURO|nr:putative LysM domain protein [Talaromyces proteolyticus]KAH8703904.1 putative LysM domain protein [Talaromyces proteolyticus]